MASLGDLTLILSSFQAASDGDVEGGAIASNSASVPSGKDLFLFATTSKPSGQGVTRTYKKMFFKNNASGLVAQAKLWIDAQERSPQIKVAHEENGAGAKVLNGTDSTNSPATKPANLTLTDFTLATSSTTALQAAGDGSLPAGAAWGIWVLREISEALLADSSVPVIFKISAANP